MSEWWTYRLSDFLLFSPRTYYRVFELHNAAIWPGQFLAIAAGAALAVLLWTPTARRLRIAAVLVAAGWLWVGWSYLSLRYASINWAASYFALAFLLQAAMLASIAFAGGRLAIRSAARPAGRIGIAMVAFAVFVQPLGGLLAGRSWSQIELFAVTPDPTVVATLGMLIASSGRGRWLALVIPIAWCAVSGATALAMGSPDAWVMPAAAATALVASIRYPSRPERSDPSAIDVQAC